MTSAEVVRNSRERLRVAAVRLAFAGALAAAAWLTGAVVAHADESPTHIDVPSPPSISDTQEHPPTDAVARTGGLGARITESALAKLARASATRGQFAEPLLTEDDTDVRGGTTTTLDADEAEPVPGDGTSTTRATRTRSAEGSASAVRTTPEPAPPPVEPPAPAPVHNVIGPEPEIAPVAPARPVVAVRPVVTPVADPPQADRDADRDLTDLPGPEPRQPTPTAPSSTSLGGTASDNGGARGATALVTTGLPRLSKPSLVTVERPLTSGAPHDIPGLPPTSPD